MNLVVKVMTPMKKMGTVMMMMMMMMMMMRYKLFDLQLHVDLNFLCLIS